MFKLTYQAYVMFYLSAGYIAVRVLTRLKDYRRIAAIIFFALLFTSLLIYPILAVRSYYGGLKKYQGLSGENWLTQYYPDYNKAILWLRNNIKGQPVILISSYTGFPTVSGWFVHEWLWRGSAKEPQERVNDITTIYTTRDTSLTQDLLIKYNIKYVVVGNFEKERFPGLNEKKFLELGRKVFSAGDTTLYSVGN
jgi:uncharacterized membrane protein